MALLMLDYGPIKDLLYRQVLATASQSAIKDLFRRDLFCLLRRY